MAITDVNPFLWPHMAHILGASSASLDAAEEHYAMILPIPKTGTLKKIGWRTVAFTAAGYSVYVALETVADAVGVPVATTRAGATLYAAGAESAEITAGLAATTAFFTALNGSTGVSVTRGDMVAVTIRLTAISSGAMAIAGNQYDGLSLPLKSLSISQNNYAYLYTGSAGLWYAGMLTLEYDGEFVPVPFWVPAVSAALSFVSWASDDNPDRRGLKFRFTDCDHRLDGANIYVDADSDVDIILYDYDEYTVMTGFPITLDKDKRRTNGVAGYYIPFTTRPTITKDQWYRLVMLPKNTTDISTYYNVPADDGAILGMTALHEGLNVAYTTFNGAPSSGSHAWTDDTTKKISMGVMVDGLELGSASSGGRPEFRGGNL